MKQKEFKSKEKDQIEKEEQHKKIIKDQKKIEWLFKQKLKSAKEKLKGLTVKCRKNQRKYHHEAPSE